MRLLAFAFAVPIALAGCRCDPGQQPDGGTDAGVDAGPAYDEFDAWREMRQLVRKSPDAVPARAEALVAAKDATALFELVRDDIGLLPTTNHSLENADTAVRWGPRATLLGQAGTPRERAELLKDLYVRAGFSAEVVVGVPAVGATATGLLGRAPQRKIVYPATDAELARWAGVLKRDARLPRPPASPLDLDGGVVASILGQVKPLLPAPPAPVAFDPVVTSVPLVKVTVGGVTQYANPNLDGATFGKSLTVDTPVAAPAATGERQLHVVLSAARSSKPGETFTLAEHTWAAGEVAGRTVTAAFTAPMSRAQAAKERVRDANAFIPTLVVRGDGLDLAAAQQLSVVGTPVLKDGARVTPASGGGLVIDGEPIAAGPTPVTVLTSVSSVAVSASAAAFPDIELLVSAKKSDGTTVPGLAANAFLVQEDGKYVVASLRRTSAGAPRVVLLFDRSTSIPMEFVTGAPAVGHAIADAVLTQFPGAQLQVAGVDINGPTLAGPMVSTLAAVDTQLAGLAGTGSEVWTAIDEFAASRATCIVVITDAVLDDTLSREMAARIVSGPPVLLAAVGTADLMTGARIAEVTNGKLLTGVTTTNLAASVTAFLADRVGHDYRVVYRAETTGAATRNVKVSLRMPGTASGTAGYTVPAMPVAAGALSALYLTVETDGRSLTRRLAGSAEGKAADVEEVAGALFGRYVLGVEAGAPSFSTLFDEHLAERLELEAGIDALRSGDMKAIADANKRSVFHSPSDLRFFSAPMPGEASAGDVTFTDGLTVTMHATRPVLGVKVVRRFDMMALVPRETVSFSGAEATRTTLDRTAALAAFESIRFTKNTKAALAGKPLAKFDALGIEQMFGAKWQGVVFPLYGDFDILAPTDGSVVAFWAVHKRTGELIGGMEIGGPGEDESTAALVDRLLTILDAAGRAGEAFGYEGVKAWADLEATKVTLLGSVIMLFEGEGGDPRGDLERNMCGSFLDALGGQLPFWDDLNRIPNDLGSIYRTIHVGTGVDVPPVNGPSGAICGALIQ